MKSLVRRLIIFIALLVFVAIPTVTVANQVIVESCLNRAAQDITLNDHGGEMDCQADQQQ